MSNKPFFWSWQDAITESELHSTTRLVLLTLSTFMNVKNTAAYPTQDDLARCSGLSVRAVKQHLQIAKEAGFISTSKHGFAGQKWANNEYKATMPAPKKGSAYDDSAELKVVQEVPKGSAYECKKVVQEVHTNNPINNPTITHTPKSPKGTDVFETMWRDINPNLVQTRRGGKDKARKAFYSKAKVHGEVELANAMRGFYRHPSNTKQKCEFAPAIVVALRGDKFEPFLGHAAAPRQTSVSNKFAALAKETSA